MDERKGKIEYKEDPTKTLRDLAGFVDFVKITRGKEVISKKEAETIHQRFVVLFNKTGITFEDDEDRNYQIQIAYMNRFAQVFSKAPSDSDLEQKDKEDLMFCVEESFQRIAKELYQNDNPEFLDKFIHDQVKDFPTKIHKELDRVLGVGWTESYNSGVFMKNYSEAYKKGYLRELSGMYVNGLLRRVVLSGQHHTNAKEFYEKLFFFKDSNSEIKDQEILWGTLKKEEKRFTDCLTALGKIPRGHLKEKVFRDSFKNLKDMFGVSVESLSLIENKNLAMGFADKLIKKIDELELMISRWSKGDEFYEGLQEDLYIFRQKIKELIKSKTGKDIYK